MPSDVTGRASVIRILHATAQLIHTASIVPILPECVSSVACSLTAEVDSLAKDRKNRYKLVRSSFRKLY
jgi:hypothetical protein